MLVLDSGGVTFFAGRSGRAVALRRHLEAQGDWPPFVPTTVLVEAVAGTDRDAPTNQFLKQCTLVPFVTERLARRAAFLHAKARRGSAVDAIVVAFAEPGGTVLTSDAGDLDALAAYASDVAVHSV